MSNVSYPNQYAHQGLVTSGDAAVAFGFNAGLVRVTNDGAGSAWLKFASTEGGLASTADYRLSSGEALELRGMGAGIGGLCLHATSTGGPSVRIGAWG